MTKIEDLIDKPLTKEQADLIQKIYQKQIDDAWNYGYSTGWCEGRKDLRAELMDVLG